MAYYSFFGMSEGSIALSSPSAGKSYTLSSESDSFKSLPFNSQTPMSIDGGSGSDVAIFKFTSTDYKITNQTNGSINISGIKNYSGYSQYENITLLNFEFVKFIDTTISLGSTSGSSVQATEGNDKFVATTINETINGGGGIDSVQFTGARSSYTINKTATGWNVNSTSGGSDSLSNIERLQFSDKMIALDIDGNAGQAYRVYQAAFNRTPDNGGLKYWIGLMDSGISLDTVASSFIASAEFTSLYGVNPSTTDFVSRLYDNVLHRAPDQSGYNYWVGLLDTHKIGNAEALRLFSESQENQAGVIGVIQNGIELLL